MQNSLLLVKGDAEVIAASPSSKGVGRRHSARSFGNTRIPLVSAHLVSLRAKASGWHCAFRARVLATLRRPRTARNRAARKSVRLRWKRAVLRRRLFLWTQPLQFHFAGLRVPPEHHQNHEATLPRPNGSGAGHEAGARSCRKTGAIPIRPAPRAPAGGTTPHTVRPNRSA